MLRRRQELAGQSSGRLERAEYTPALHSRHERVLRRSGQSAAVDVVEEGRNGVRHGLVEFYRRQLIISDQRFTTMVALVVSHDRPSNGATDNTIQ